MSLCPALHRKRTLTTVFSVYGNFFFILMSSDLPRVLVWGHSFVKRLSADLERGFQQRARGDFNLASRARVTFPTFFVGFTRVFIIRLGNYC